jgi:peroxiredoxin
MVEEGKPAPDFELTSDAGDRVKLSDFPREAGRPLLLSQGRHARNYLK